jgi:hypothetical protein
MAEEEVTQTVDDSTTEQVVVENEVEAEHEDIPTFVVGTGKNESVGADEDSPPEGSDADEDEASSVDDGLLRWAADAGYSPEEVERFGADNMRSILVKQDQQIANAYRQRFGGNGQNRGQDTGQQAAVPPEQTPGNRTERDAKFKIDMSQFEDLDPVIPQTLEKLNDFYGQQLNQRDEYVSQLEKKLNAVVNSLQQREDLQRLAEFDSALESLGPEYRDDFGEGPSTDVVPGTRAYRNRAEVIQVVEALRQMNPRAPMSRLVPRAVNAVLGDKLKNIARKEVREKAKSAASQATGRGKQTRTTQKKSATAQREDLMERWRGAVGAP